jgi:hypothetical protein
LLVSGALEVRRRENGDDGVIAALTPGAGFREVGLLQGVPRTASVVARERRVVLRVRGDGFVATVNAVAPGAGGTLGCGLRATRSRSPRADHDLTPVGLRLAP